MSDFDIQRYADQLNQDYASLVPSGWVAPLARNHRSLCAIDHGSAPSLFAVCNTTETRVAFSHTESPDVVARRLWAAVQAH